MARFRAKQGQGHPVIGGRVIDPGKGGIYQVDAPRDIEAMRAHGYIDVDAKPEAAPEAPALRLGLDDK